MTQAIVIGGGHNGLVAAGYLARAGMRVSLFEAADRFGGAARTEALTSDIQVSAVAHVLHQLDPDVIVDLALEEHGLVYANSDLETVLLAPDRRHLVMKRGSGELVGEGVSADDALAWSQLSARLTRIAGIMRPLLADIPPRLRNGVKRDQFTMGKLAWRLRRLGREDMREALRILLMNVADLGLEAIEDERLRAALAIDGVLGVGLGPRSPGTVLNLLYRMSGDVVGEPGAMALPQGGLGAVSEALSRSAESAGATLVAGAAVEAVLLRPGRCGPTAAGVRLVTGDEVPADIVVSAVDPKTTFEKLVGLTELDIGFARRIRNIRAKGRAAKVNLALSGVPEFVGLDRLHLDGRLLIGPDVASIERAFDASKYGDASEEPMMEITIPSIADPRLAPAGMHVLSAVVQYAPYDVNGGWDAQREPFLSRTIATLAKYAPGLQDLITVKQLLTPLDLEKKYGLPGGHWHHGELAPDQMLMLRPIPELGQYDSPVGGLYLCSAGMHPGGGVTGAPGKNAAARVIAREMR